MKLVLPLQNKARSDRMKSENMTGHKQWNEFSLIGERIHKNRQNSSAHRDEVIIGFPCTSKILQFIIRDLPAQFRYV